MSEKPKSLIEQLDAANTQSVAALSASEVAKAESNPDLLASLVRLLLLKEGREAAKAQIEVNAEAARAKQRDANSGQKNANLLLKQARCKHLKGNRGGMKNTVNDYAVSKHTFINAQTVIKCLICGAKWRPEDTVEWLIRDGRKVSNHTHIGWREANDMMTHSSNTPTSSEIPADVIIKGTAGLSERGDAAGLPVELTILDSEGKTAHNIEL